MGKYCSCELIILKEGIRSIVIIIKCFTFLALTNICTKCILSYLKWMFDFLILFSTRAYPLSILFSVYLSLARQTKCPKNPCYLSFLIHTQPISTFVISKLNTSIIDSQNGSKYNFVELFLQ